RTWAGGEVEAPEGIDANPTALSDPAQGLEVRLGIWNGTLAMSRAFPLWGVGPGQFRQAFPPHRLIGEIEKSSHDRAIQNAVEVEHPHNDFLLAIAELGWPLGLLWIGLCLWILRRMLGNLIDSDRTRVVPSLAGLGVLMLSVWNGPLLGPVISHPLAWLCFGLAVGPIARPRPAKFGIAVAAACLVLAGLQLGRAVDFVQHGRALIAGAEDSSALDHALAITSDSTLALDYAVHAVPPPKNAGPDAQAWLATLRPRFEKLLEKRPHAVGLFNDWGRALAIAGQFEEADRAFASALELDPGFTPAHSNRVRADVDRRDLEALGTHLAAALKAKALEPDYVRNWGLYCLRNARPEVARVLLSSAGKDLDVTDANVCHIEAARAR
ncbi:MAG: hypothetical protein KDB61_14585, partial [Planctomycetes bacterium]|nr:hypothetical protein [Planctomycetota bacterium]